jgi:chemotaxis protein MotB
MKKRVDRRYLDAEESVAGWQTIYCSLSLIMVVLFIMLVSYSVADRKKMRDLRGTVAGNGANVEKVKNGAETNVGPAEKETMNDGAWISNATLSLSQAGEISGLKGDVTVERFNRGLKFKFKSDVIFSSGSAMVSGKIYPYLDEMIKIANEQNLSVRVEGHTDDVPIRSMEFPSNWDLSAARSANVIRYFITKSEFPARRLAAEGFAQYRPLASNSSPEGREQNRRIEVYLEPGKDETLLKGQNDESKNP